jgi:hypothetical protein
MGLNSVLEKAVLSLSEENSVVSWAIYKEENGHISLKIRFKPLSEAAKCDSEEIHYRKTPHSKCSGTVNVLTHGVNNNKSEMVFLMLTANRWAKHPGCRRR